MPFDVVTATPPDLIQHADPSAARLRGDARHRRARAAERMFSEGIIRTAGGMALTWSKKAFPNGRPPSPGRISSTWRSSPDRAPCLTPATANGGCRSPHSWPTACRATSCSRWTRPRLQEARHAQAACGGVVEERRQRHANHARRRCRHDHGLFEPRGAAGEERRVRLHLEPVRSATSATGRCSRADRIRRTRCASWTSSCRMRSRASAIQREVSFDSNNLAKPPALVTGE